MIARLNRRTALLALLPALVAAGCTRPPFLPGTAESAISQAWMRHLLAKEGRYMETTGVPSDDWLTAEQHQWPIYDLAGSYLPDGARPEVLSIRPEPGPDDEYRIVTAFHADDDRNAMRSRLIRLTVFARRVDGRWRFGNALPRLTRDWHREQVAQITYVIAPGQSFDRTRATAAATFIDSLATAFDLPRLDHLTYYLTPSEDEFLRILGLDTDIKWGPVGGLGQPGNYLLFSGIPSLGEAYRHELAHIVLRPLVADHPTTFLISEGVPTWLGGTTGMDFPTATRGLAELLRQHQSITLDTVMARQGPVDEFYPAGAVFVDMTYRQGGTAAVKALFDAGPTDAAFRAGAERLFRKPWAEIAAEWRAHALSIGTPR